MSSKSTCNIRKLILLKLPELAHVRLLFEPGTEAFCQSKKQPDVANLNLSKSEVPFLRRNPQNYSQREAQIGGLLKYGYENLLSFSFAN